MSERNQKATILWLVVLVMVLAGIFVWRIFFAHPAAVISDRQIKQGMPLPANAAAVRLEDIVRQAQTWAPAYQEWVGKKSPDFELADIKGKKYKLSEHRGKTVMVVFWATWCPPCRMEVPGLIELRKSTGEEKLGMVGISFEDVGIVKDFVEKAGINYTIVSTAGVLPVPFSSITALPTTFYIDKSGVIRLVTEGFVGDKETTLILQAIADPNGQK